MVTIAPLSRPRGFTLVEMITVIVLLGVLAGVTSVFIAPSIRSYTDSERRARLTDIADTALRRIARDVQAALPNSVRTEGNQLDLIPVLAGGRYEHNSADSEGCFAQGCSRIKSLGDVIDLSRKHKWDYLVIYNLSNNINGDCDANAVDGLPSAWCGHNLAQIQDSTDGGTNDSFSFSPQTFRPGTGSPKRTFFIVGTPIAYACTNIGVSGGTGTGELRRYSGCRLLDKPNDLYGALCASTQGRVLADRLSDCQISYQAINERLGLLAMELEIQEQGEKVRLYHEVHVDNAP